MDFRRSLRFGAAILTLALSASPSLAQGGLAAAQSVRCTFPRQAAGTWAKDGAADAAVRPATLVLRFESIDADGGTAQIRNGTVVTDVTVRWAAGYLNFMQAFRTGPLYTTTVFEAGSAGGRFKAVHSRHEYFTAPVSGATSSPEQYYGECEIVR